MLTGTVTEDWRLQLELRCPRCSYEYLVTVFKIPECDICPICGLHAVLEHFERGAAA